MGNTLILNAGRGTMSLLCYYNSVINCAVLELTITFLPIIIYTVLFEPETANYQKSYPF